MSSFRAFASATTVVVLGFIAFSLWFTGDPNGTAQNIAGIVLAVPLFLAAVFARLTRKPGVKPGPRQFCGAEINDLGVTRICEQPTTYWRGHVHRDQQGSWIGWPLINLPRRTRHS